MMARASPELMNQTWVVELTAELSELDVLTLDVICRNERDHGSSRVSWGCGVLNSKNL